MGGPFGYYTLVINRPGYTALAQPAANTLLLSKETDPSFPERISPFFQSDLSFSKKNVTTKGRRALDDLTIAIRDTLGYSGTVNSVFQSEQFNGDYKTFFDVWFSNPLQYKAWVLSYDFASGNSDVPFRGYIDPAYKPSSDPEIYNVGTMQQIWVGTRTIKIVAQKQSITWQDVLNLIGAGDCESGQCYNGQMSGNGFGGFSNSRAGSFSSDKGNWYQAVPHYYKPGNDPQWVGAPAPVWPASPWTSQTASNQILQSHVIFILGTGYAVNDTGTINGGSTLATYKVLSIDAGTHVVTLQLTTLGAGYTTGLKTTTATSGSGSGLIIYVDKTATGVNWGPSGLVFISVATLIARFATALDCSKFSSSSGDFTLVSPIDWFCQKADNTNKNFPVNTTPITLSNLFINLNVIACSHPHDGGYWSNPIGFAPTTPALDALSSLCNLLLDDYAIVNALDGTSVLFLRKIGEIFAALPADWVPVAIPSEEEPATGPLAVQVNLKGDSLKIQSPIGTQFSDGAATFETLLNIHRIGNTSGNDPANDTECFMWDDSKTIDEQHSECFEIAFRNDDGTYNPNPNLWKGLRFLYWESNAGDVYPSTWSPFPNNDGSAGSWNNSFYAVNAIQKGGVTPDPNLCGTPNGRDYFNTRDLHAVAFAATNLSLPIVQSYQYAGVADSSGSLQNIAPGLSGTWLYEGNAQSWRSIEVLQAPNAGLTNIKFQAELASGFPDLTTLTYGPVGTTGTSSSSSSTTTSTGGSTPSQTLSFWPYIFTRISGAGTQTIPAAATINYCDDVTTTGVSIADSGPPAIIQIINVTGATFTTGDFKVPDSTTWICSFVKAGISFDPLVKTGWQVIAHNP